MESISVTVCDKKWAGTDGDVVLGFQTKSNAVSTSGEDDNCTQNCRTGIMDTKYSDWVNMNDFERGITQVWKGKFLADCDSSTFRPTKDLEVLMDVGSTFGWTNKVKICKIVVSFEMHLNSTGIENSKIDWKWTGAKWFDENTQADWLKMDKV